MISFTPDTSLLYRQCAFETVYCCCLHRTHFRRTQNMLSTPYAWGRQYHRALQASFTIDFARYALLRACRRDVVAVSASCTARLHNPRRTCAAPALQMWLNVSPVKTSGPMDLFRWGLCCLCESVLEAMVVVVGLDMRQSVCVCTSPTRPVYRFCLSFTMGACSPKWSIDTSWPHTGKSASCDFDSHVPCRELLASRHPAPAASQHRSIAASQHRNNVSQ